MGKLRDTRGESMNKFVQPLKHIEIHIEIVADNDKYMMINGHNVTEISISEFSWIEQAIKECSRTAKTIENRHPCFDTPIVKDEYVAIP
jgi:hypothetical protein